MNSQEVKQVTVPLLPGNSFREVREDYRKPHALDYKNGYAIQSHKLVGIGMQPINRDAIDISADQLLASLGAEPKLTYGDKQFHTAKLATPRFVPAYVALDKVVLRFDAYFKETVHESVEQYHLRKVRILYYLEDDSIAVVEPPVENSGIPQRVFIKRQRLPNEAKAIEGVYYNIRDFNLGINMEFYGRVFRIIGCDKFTENYMKETENITLNAPEATPVDPYIEQRNRPRRDYSVPSISPTIRHNDKLKKFMDFDRKVLRFYCIWDDRENMFGELREFILHYYLVDDCMEVREVAKPNNGRDPFPILLRKQQLAKTTNVDGTEVKYTPSDLRIGSFVNVLGRPFLIHDCDKYTRQYYKETLNLTNLQMEPIQFQDSDQEKNKSNRLNDVVEQETAPYNGFGTIEDSLGSCKHLVLKPPKKDFIKMLENEHKVLRFVAKMESKHKEDKDRRFVISYRLADDNMTIYEPPQRNAGVLGGKFMERTRVLKPNQFEGLSSVSALGSTKTPDYYNADDMYIGANMDICRHKFVLIDADEYVFNYMESRKDEFPKSNHGKVLEKVKSKDVFNTQIKDDVKNGVCGGLLGLGEGEGGSGSSIVDRKSFLQVVKKVLGDDSPLVEHEIITLCRPFEDKHRKLDWRKFLDAY